MIAMLGRGSGTVRRSSELVVPPASEPVSLVEAKSHLRVDTSAEDDLIADLISASRERIEAAVGRSLITQNWVLALDAWPIARAWVDLPRPPLQQINAVRIYDSDGTVSTWSAEAYFADLSAAPGRLILRAGEAWPIPGRPLRGIEIDYATGYGPTGSNVPGPLRQAILMDVAQGFERRGEEDGAGRAPWSGLVEPYRVRSL